MCQILNLEKISLDAASSTHYLTIFHLQEFWEPCQLVPALSLLCSYFLAPKFPVNKVSERSRQQQIISLGSCWTEVLWSPPTQHNLPLPWISVFLLTILLHLILLITPFLELSIGFWICWYSVLLHSCLLMLMSLPLISGYSSRQILYCLTFSHYIWVLGGICNFMVSTVIGSGFQLLLHLTDHQNNLGDLLKDTDSEASLE